MFSSYMKRKQEIKSQEDRHCYDLTKKWTHHPQCNFPIVLMYAWLLVDTYIAIYRWSLYNMKNYICVEPDRWDQASVLMI